MKLIQYSDLHLEYGAKFKPNTDGDVLILAGDICNLDNLEPLCRFLDIWGCEKPVLYVAGNHEYYSYSKNMFELDSVLENLPYNLHFLNNKYIKLGDTYFFGGTCWTGFNKSDFDSMKHAEWNMSDFRLITTPLIKKLTAKNTVSLHNIFKKELRAFLKAFKKYKRVVITHHSPIENPRTKYVGSKLQPAFVCTDMEDIIYKHQPDLWIYGHTHENYRVKLGSCQIWSNQRGYYEERYGYVECEEDFIGSGEVDGC